MSRLILLFVLAGCGLSERSDFLIGRQCTMGDAGSCDEGQACLPHVAPRFAMWRCRDRASFEQIDGREPPLAYCNSTIKCPGDLVCNADRIRGGDAGRRLLVCKRPDDVFAPPPPP